MARTRTATRAIRGHGVVDEVVDAGTVVVVVVEGWVVDVVGVVVVVVVGTVDVVGVVVVVVEGGWVDVVVVVDPGTVVVVATRTALTGGAGVAPAGGVRGPDQQTDVTEAAARNAA